MTAHPLDLAVVIAYALAMVGFGLYFYFRVNRYADYYDGGRTWGVWIVGCAVAATNIGAGNTMGSVAMAYRDGFSAMWYVTLQALAFIPFAYVAVHKIYPLKETTLAEYLETRYQPWLRPISAVALALATFAILPAQIVGGASVLTALLGMDYTTAFLAVGITLILYSALGGMPSVTYGDVYQWVLMLGGFLIGVPIFVSVAGGLQHILSSTPATHASWTSGATGTWNPPTIAAWLVTVVMARFGSQEWYQRIRASKSPEASRNGFVLGGLMAAPFGILTMVVGIAALEQMPGLANPEEAFARSMMSAMPVGLRALMMSAILAAVVTSGESSVNAATALFVNDVCKRLVPDRSDRFYLRLSQVSCAVLGLIALALALNAPHIVEYIRLGFMIRTPVAITVLMGLYWRGANATGAAAAIVIGTAAVLGWQNLGDPRWLDPFWIAAPVTMVALVAGSRLSRSSEHSS
ncbi:MAG TPA: sodium:solute symporter family protein [Vicinamibacterales bacterium]|nr:sodium:solute symporter family protein [Vicinamibacterales bacterium]